MPGSLSQDADIDKTPAQVLRKLQIHARFPRGTVLYWRLALTSRGHRCARNMSVAFAIEALFRRVDRV